MSAWVQRARWCALVSSLGLYACSSDEEGDLTPRTLEVGDARVTPGDDGGIAISVGDRDLIQLASQGPIARRFGWSYSGATALFTFERTGEEAVQLEYDTGHAAREDSGVVIPLRAASGFGGEGALAGAVHFSEERLGTTRVRVEVAASYDSLALPLVCTPESSFYGFGGQYNAIDQRGEVFDLFVREQGIGRDPQKPYGFLNGGPHTTYFPMPYFVDARGFGVYWRTDRRSLLDLCRSEPDVAWIEVESGEPLDLLLLHGPTMPRVVEALSEVGLRRVVLPESLCPPALRPRLAAVAQDLGAGAGLVGQPHPAVTRDDDVLGPLHAATDALGAGQIDRLQVHRVLRPGV